MARYIDPAKIEEIVACMNSSCNFNSVMYDTVRDLIIVRGPLPWDADSYKHFGCSGRCWTDMDFFHLFAYMQTNYGYEGGERTLMRGLETFARQCLYVTERRDA